MQISIPSKTFLLGEYAVLNQAPGWVINTLPTFTFMAEEKNYLIENPLRHQKNPTALLYQKNKNLLQNYQINFIDPYQGSGGFGASTAYFLGLFILIKKINNQTFDIFNPNERLQLLTEYLSCSDHQPSGVDLIAQACDGITYFDRKNNQLKKLAWPFDDLSFLICKTNHKIATHQHLKALKKIDTAELEKIIAQFDFYSKDSLINTIAAYGIELKKQNLVCENTQKLLATIHSNPNILAAKGCGALGADVILVITETAKIQSVIEYLKLLSLYPLKGAK